MSLHERYLQQSAWTRELRSYLFDRTGWASARRVLEVGCGTGVILRDVARAGLHNPGRSPLLCGVDIAAEALADCRVYAPAARLARADALALPFCSRAFDIVYCHFLLLWVAKPLEALREMKRVTRRHVLALAEPDYSARVDLPQELMPLGRLQGQALAAQGADVDLGSRLAQLFDQAGIRVVEAGAMQPWSAEALTAADLQAEWTMLEQDLQQTVPPAELERLRRLDLDALRRGERRLHVPTYFAWGQV